MRKSVKEVQEDVINDEKHGNQTILLGSFDVSSWETDVWPFGVVGHCTYLVGVSWIC